MRFLIPLFFAITLLQSNMVYADKGKEPPSALPISPFVKQADELKAIGFLGKSFEEILSTYEAGITPTETVFDQDYTGKVSFGVEIKRHKLGWEVVKVNKTQSAYYNYYKLRKGQILYTGVKGTDYKIQHLADLQKYEVEDMLEGVPGEQLTLGVIPKGKGKKDIYLLSFEFIETPYDKLLKFVAAGYSLTTYKGSTHIGLLATANIENSDVSYGVIFNASSLDTAYHINQVLTYEVKENGQKTITVPKKDSRHQYKYFEEFFAAQWRYDGPAKKSKYKTAKAPLAVKVSGPQKADNPLAYYNYYGKEALVAHNPAGNSVSVLSGFRPYNQEEFDFARVTWTLYDPENGLQSAYMGFDASMYPLGPIKPIVGSLKKGFSNKLKYGKYAFYTGRVNPVMFPLVSKDTQQMVNQPKSKNKKKTSTNITAASQAVFGSTGYGFGQEEVYNNEQIAPQMGGPKYALATCVVKPKSMDYVLSPDGQHTITYTPKMQKNCGHGIWNIGYSNAPKTNKPYFFSQYDYDTNRLFWAYNNRIRPLMKKIYEKPFHSYYQGTVLNPSADNRWVTFHGYGQLYYQFERDTHSLYGLWEKGALDYGDLFMRSGIVKPTDFNKSKPKYVLGRSSDMVDARYVTDYSVYKETKYNYDKLQMDKRRIDIKNSWWGYPAITGMALTERHDKVREIYIFDRENFIAYPTVRQRFNADNSSEVAYLNTDAYAETFGVESDKTVGGQFGTYYANYFDRYASLPDKEYREESTGTRTQSSANPAAYGLLRGTKELNGTTYNYIGWKGFSYPFNLYANKHPFVVNNETVGTRYAALEKCGDLELFWNAADTWPVDSETTFFRCAAENKNYPAGISANNNVIFFDKLQGDSPVPNQYGLGFRVADERVVEYKWENGQPVSAYSVVGYTFNRYDLKDYEWLAYYQGPVNADGLEHGRGNSMFFDGRQLSIDSYDKTILMPVVASRGVIQPGSQFMSSLEQYAQAQYNQLERQKRESAERERRYDEERRQERLAEQRKKEEARRIRRQKEAQRRSEREARNRQNYNDLRNKLLGDTQRMLDQQRANNERIQRYERERQRIVRQQRAEEEARRRQEQQQADNGRQAEAERTRNQNAENQRRLEREAERQRLANERRQREDAARKQQADNAANDNPGRLNNDQVAEKERDFQSAKKAREEADRKAQDELDKKREKEMERRKLGYFNYTTFLVRNNFDEKCYFEFTVYEYKDFPGQFCRKAPRGNLFDDMFLEMHNPGTYDIIFDMTITYENGNVQKISGERVKAGKKRKFYSFDVDDADPEVSGVKRVTLERIYQKGAYKQDAETEMMDIR